MGKSVHCNQTSRWAEKNLSWRKNNLFWFAIVAICNSDSTLRKARHKKKICISDWRAAFGFLCIEIIWKDYWRWWLTSDIWGIKYYSIKISICVNLEEIKFCGFLYQPNLISLSAYSAPQNLIYSSFIYYSKYSFTHLYRNWRSQYKHSNIKISVIKYEKKNVKTCEKDPYIGSVVHKRYILLIFKVLFNFQS